MAEIRVTSDGTIEGTRVVDNATGEELEGVRSVVFRHEAGKKPVVIVELDGAVVDAAGDGWRGRRPGPAGAGVDVTLTLPEDLDLDALDDGQISDLVHGRPLRARSDGEADPAAIAGTRMTPFPIESPAAVLVTTPGGPGRPVPVTLERPVPAVTADGCYNNVRRLYLIGGKAAVPPIDGLPAILAPGVPRLAWSVSESLLNSVENGDGPGNDCVDQIVSDLMEYDADFETEDPAEVRAAVVWWRAHNPAFGEPVSVTAVLGQDPVKAKDYVDLPDDIINELMHGRIPDDVRPYMIDVSTAEDVRAGRRRFEYCGFTIVEVSGREHPLAALPGGGLVRIPDHQTREVACQCGAVQRVLPGKFKSSCPVCGSELPGARA